MPSKLKELYERYRQRGEFPSRLQIKLDMEALLAEEDDTQAHQKVTIIRCKTCEGRGWIGNLEGHICLDCKSTGYIKVES